MKLVPVLIVLLAAAGPAALAQAALPAIVPASTEATAEAFVELRGVKVPGGIARTDAVRLVDMGVLETDGYAQVVLNFAGAVLEGASEGGVAGVVLVPDVAPFDKAFRDFQMVPATIEISSPYRSVPAFFMARQVTADVGFPRYRVLAYNTGSGTVQVGLFAYRTRR
ncbi:MAG: hypothetical protein MUC67_13330 [Acidobacteria bacterium]|jgi:hypothetical protein|nr:hypothetical protein [Acidobacteriota bacterium]MCU0254504.1 hypothetical protein [Acidobacteriota bacterium]